MHRLAKNPFRYITLWLAIGVLISVIILKADLLAAGIPGTDCDEAVYIEPAVHFYQSGVFASPGIASQLAQKGCPGLDEHCFLEAPLAAYFRAAGYELVGADQMGRRMMDGVFFLVVLGAFFYAVLPFTELDLALILTAMFGLERFIFSIAGRPDILSLSFGLLAFGVVLRLGLRREETPGSGLGAVFFAGLMVGLSGLAHPFGGVFWGTLCSACLGFFAWQKAGRHSWIKTFTAFGLGGACVLLLWLPQIITAPHLWQEQFFFMISFKAGLVKNFHSSAMGLFFDFRKYHCLFVLLIVSCFIPWRNQLCQSIRNILIACLTVLAIWRCHSFEPYNGSYIIHFLGVAWIIFAMAIREICGFLGRFVTEKPLGFLKFAVVCIMLFETACVSFYSIGRAAPPPTPAAMRAVNRLIKPGEKILACPACFFDLTSTNKSLWYWGEHLDLGTFDVIVSRYQQVPVQDGGDQWGDVFTTAQARLFKQQFQLAAQISSVKFSKFILPAEWIPPAQDIFIYQRTPAALK